MEEVERFKTIEYNSYVAERYEVSTLGRVRNKQTGRIFTAFPRKKGDYAAVVLQIGAGQQKTFSVHLLVAKAFLPNPNNLPEINHKNQNKMDARLSNLEWCDRKYNMNYGDVGGRILHMYHFLYVKKMKLFTGIKRLVHGSWDCILHLLIRS